MPENSNPKNRLERSEEISLREQITKYLRHWPWFLGTVILSVIAANIYLRYSTPIYSTTASIIIRDENKKGGNSDLAAFADLGLLGGMGTNSIENEIGILKSRRLLTSISSDLQLQIRYFVQGNLRTTEIYNDRPFNVQIIEIDERKFQNAETFEVRLLDKNQAEIRNETTNFKKTIDFGVPVELPFGKFVFTPNSENQISEDSETYIVHFGTIEGVVDSYRRVIQVNLTDKNSTLIELGLQGPVRRKSEDILNRLIYQYNKEAIEDKNEVSLNTANFIDERLVIISSELDSVETGKQEFKIDHRLTNIEAESQLFLVDANEFRKQQLEVETQLELANSIIEYLKNDKEGLLPANLGFREATLVSAINSYNQIVLERNRILASSTKINPVVINLDNQIQDMRASVMQSLLNLQNSLKISKKDLESREVGVNAQIANVPSKERQFRGILRQQNIKEALYLYLLQKREETNLALAATSPKAKIVDSAYSSKQPIAPKSRIVLLASFIIGLLIPFSIIYIRDLLNNKIQSKADLVNETKEIPLIGEMPQLQRGQKDVIEGEDRSVLAESFRILHTNLQYLLIKAKLKPGGNIILVTSTIKGEGKTFVAFNLALTMAQANNRILIVGGDLRNPQLQRYEPDAKNIKGVSDFLVSEDLEVRNYIKNSSHHPNLDILPSGMIPPNPAVLWRDGKTESMFAQLKEMYDFIILDTAPAMLVTDTFLISKYADLTLYVMRAGYTTKNLSHFALDAQEEGKLENIGFVLNEVKAANFGYGNKYGYYYAYGEETKSTWEKIKGKLML